MRISIHNCTTGEVTERDMTPQEEAEHAAATAPPTPEYLAAKLDELVEDEFARLNNIIRALALMIMDEFNRHSAVHTAILQAAANSSSYGAFRAAMGQIQPVPTRTAAQIKAAIRSKLGQ